MREILFRGKGECGWSYGSLIYSPKENQYYIVENTEEELSFSVDKESVGQYTGLTDKNGTKIFEGDVLEYIKAQRATKSIIKTGLVFYDITATAYCFKINNEENKPLIADLLDISVIGNIHDNPELLEER